jgi:DNA-binding IclR family transcriptional regulator
LSATRARPAAKLQTADRALQVLQAFAAPGEALSVGELAKRLRLHRSTTSRLVSTLEARGFLQRNGHDTLTLGAEIVRLGRLALAGRPLVEVARPVIDELAQRSGETVTLAVPAGSEVVTVAQSDGRYFVSSAKWVGVHAPPHCCSDGKVLLAFGAIPPPKRRLERLAPNTITDRRALEAELARVRRDGFATADSELEDGLVGVAAPVRAEGRCLAAVCISGPRYRLKPEAVPRLAAICRDAAAEIARRCAGEPPQHGPQAENHQRGE